MTIYLIMDGNTSVRAYKKVEDARAQMDVLMFAKCKRGFKILEAKNDSYAYTDGGSLKNRLYLNEVELQE